MSEHPLAADLDHILAHTEGLWEELRGQQLFITGGTGFFGSWLLESFAWANARLNLGASALVLTRDVEAFRLKAPHLAFQRAIRFHAGDVRSFDFPEGRFPYVIHAATEARSRLDDANRLLMFDTIVRGTWRTLDWAHHCGARKFLLISSGAVYGEQPPEVTHLPEDYRGAPDPLDAGSVYGEGKRAAELLCATYARQYGLETKIARCFAFVGPYLPLDAHFAIGNFIRDRLRGGPIRVQGDGTAHRSYLYAADLAIWLWHLLFRGAPERPYNVGSEESISMSDLAELVAANLAPKVPVQIAMPAGSRGSSQHYVPCVARIKSELNLHQYISLSEAIAKTLVWFDQQHGAGSRLSTDDMRIGPPRGNGS